MGSLIFGALSLFASSMLARVLIGGGLTLLVSAGVSAAVDGLLGDAIRTLGSLPATVLDLVLLGGLGTALSVIGSALLTRAAILAAGRVLGVSIGGNG